MFGSTRSSGFADWVSGVAARHGDPRAGSAPCRARQVPPYCFDQSDELDAVTGSVTFTVSVFPTTA